MRNLLEIIEANSIPEPNSGCWIWTRATNPSGRGLWWWNKRLTVATHLALLSVGVKVPPKMMACHRCDNASCVNPDHLFIGTNADNMRDMRQKGRSRGRPRTFFCSKGHQKTGENLYVHPTGKHRCRICEVARQQKAYAKQKGRDLRDQLTKGTGAK